MEQSDHQEYVRQPKNKLALFASYTVIILINVTLSAVILFVSAGQINWLAGWVYLLSYLIYMLVVSSYTIHRTKNVPTINKAPLWERFLDQGYLLIHPLILVLAGLEFRLFQQPSTLLIFFQIGAFALMLIAFALMGWAQAVNPYYGYPVNAIDQPDQEFISVGPSSRVRRDGLACHRTTCCVGFLLGTPAWVGRLCYGYHSNIFGRQSSTGKSKISQLCSQSPLQATGGRLVMLSVTDARSDFRRDFVLFQMFDHVRFQPLADVLV